MSALTDAQLELIKSILDNGVLVTAFLTAVGALASGLAGAVVFLVRRFVLRKLSADEIATVERLAGIATRWVEQTAQPGTPDHERLTAAVDFLLNQARARGLAVDRDFAVAVVEAAVLGIASPTEPAP